MEECYPEVLYFYCNTEVFHNIIANKKTMAFRYIKIK